MKPILNRREVLQGLGFSAASLLLPDGRAFAQKVAANDRLTVACIGVGSQGMRVMLDVLRLPEIQVVAVCDVNKGSSDYLDWGPNELRNKVRDVLEDPSWGAGLTGPTAGTDAAQRIVNAFYAKRTGQPAYSGCAAYEDYRELLNKEKQLDAVIVSTPDHWHAPIAIASMRAGKHVYSQKPMAHSVWECREMARVAKETGRATQVSIFNSNSTASRQVSEIIGSGAIGHVRSIDIWTKRSSRFWKQGLATPTQADPVPAGLNWDMWLGPAPMRPFSRAYMPFVWRAWYDFGCGALGDMGEYGFDTIARAVGLNTADRVEASTTDRFPECYPVSSSIHFHFDKTASRPELTINWLDGGLEPARPAQLPPDTALGSGGEGVIYSGDSGQLLTEFMGQNPMLLSNSGKLEKFQSGVPAAPELYDARRPEAGKSATSANAEHYLEWVRACRGGPAARANYAYEAPIVESLLLGCIAVRTHELLQWDAETFSLSGASEQASRLLKPQFRAPWGLEA